MSQLFSPVNRTLPSPLVVQVVSTLRNAIASKQLPGGQRLPSVRRGASLFSVSNSTIVQAYEQLVAEGWITARPGSGFYVAESGISETRVITANENNAINPVNDYWLLSSIYVSSPEYRQLSCGWLPDDWYQQDTLAKALRTVSRQNLSNSGYGESWGYLPLRQHLAVTLPENMQPVSPENILLTQGASKALDIVSMALLNRGDSVLVDEPAYCNFLTSLMLRGIRPIGIPWTSQGPDMDRMAEVLRREKPRLYITNPWFQNPTGACLSLGMAHKILSLMEQYGIHVVEDNVSGELMPQDAVSLLSMGGMKRVTQIRSFSKTLSPTLRVGYVIGNTELIERLIVFKMMSGLTSSELTERVILSVLQDGQYHKYRTRLRTRLAQAQTSAGQFFQTIGWQLHTQAVNGFYLYACPMKNATDALKLAEIARQHKLFLAPGTLFHPHRCASPWIRFNVAFLQRYQNEFLHFLDENKMKT
ncbi:PLP-dependent aminotransferase family protein [Brenneria goodwinii]|uniref:aminotransferase-like domain-containing protein n=1 Tax=Brenneria goodwinii TaxID=1109412 RepID=UPI0036E62EB8